MNSSQRDYEARAYQGNPDLNYVSFSLVLLAAVGMAVSPAINPIGRIPALSRETEQLRLLGSDLVAMPDLFRNITPTTERKIQNQIAQYCAATFPGCKPGESWVKNLSNLSLKVEQAIENAPNRLARKQRRKGHQAFLRGIEQTIESAPTSTPLTVISQNVTLPSVEQMQRVIGARPASPVQLKA